MLFQAVVVALAAAGLVPLAGAFPSGAGGCSGVQGSVGGVHLVPEMEPSVVESSSLEEAGLTVSFADAASSSNTTLSSITGNILSAGTPYTLYLNIDEGAAEDHFTGFLFRITSPVATTQSTSTDALDYTTLLAVDPTFADMSQISSVCTAIGIGGVTHTSADHKTSASSVIQVDTPGTYTLEVTAVFGNDWEGEAWESKWAYSTYDLTAMAVGDGGSSSSSGTTTGSSETSAEGASGAFPSFDVSSMVASVLMSVIAIAL